MVLVDTSVWIEVFRRGSTFRLESAVELDEVVTCLPVVQEVLQGFDDERAYRIAHDSMFAFPMVESPLTDRVFVEAVELYRRARRAGKTVRSGVDCLIAACAIRHGLAILHNDRDFAELAQISRLQHRPIGRGQAVKRAKGSGREA